MMKYFNLFCLTLMIISCSDNKTNDQKILDTDKNAVETVIHQSFLVNVDQLRLRNAPGLKSETIGKLKENEIVNGTNEISDIIDTIELRNQIFITPYYKVSTSKGSGWLYGGGLTKIYEGDRNLNIPKSYGQLVKDIQEIPKDKLEVGSWIVNRITNEDMSNPLVNDLYFKLACDALENIPYDSPIYSESEKIEITDDIYNKIFERKTSELKDPYFERVFQNGFQIDAGEGMLFPTLDRTRLADMIGTRLSPSTQAYNEICQIEYEKPFMTDAAIYKPLELIAEHINRRSDFASKYGSNVWSEENSKRTKTYIDYIKFGTSNTAAFDYESKKVVDEYRISWKNILSTYKDQEWTSDLSTWVNQVEENDWKRPQ